MQSILQASFRNYSLLLIVLSLLPFGVEGQKIFNQTFEFDNWQHNGQNVIELDSFYYVSGNLLEKGVPENERKAFITKISKDFETAEQFILEDKDLYHTLNNPQNLVHIGDHLYTHYLEEAFGDPALLHDYNFILSYNLISDEMKQHYVVSDSMFGNGGLFPETLIQTKKDELAYLNGYRDQTERQGILFQLIENDSSAVVLQEYRKTVSEESWYPESVIEDDDGFVIVGSRRIDSDPDYGGLFVLRLNYSLEEVGQVVFDHLRFAGNVIDVTLDSDGNFIIVVHEYVIPEYNFRPRVMKLSSDFDIIWESSFSQPDYRDYNHYYLGVIESSKEDGYLVFGRDQHNGELPLSIGIIGKISNEGDSTWFRHIHPLPEDKVRSSSFYNLIPTSDKHYLAAGSMFPSEAPDSVVTKIWLLKFDENGRIAGDTTSAAITADNLDFKIYPNPTSDLIYIEHDEAEILKYRLIDILGNVVLESPHTTQATTYVISTAHLVRGSYFLQAISDKGLQTTIPIILSDR